VHEHLQGSGQVPKLLEAMDRQGISKTVLVGSPRATLFPSEREFTRYDENNQELLRIAREHPGRFIVFVTIDPADSQKLDKLKAYIAQGARGLKLYSGHAFYHLLPLEDPGMSEVYEWCQEEGIPILFHVNPSRYIAEFENVLTQFPDLKVICPHFCLSVKNPLRLERLLDRYPNLYTDVSFGFPGYVKEALVRVSEDPQRYREMVEKYQDRFLFGTDMVVTEHEGKTADWLEGMIKAYRGFLEHGDYEFFLFPEEPLRGLHLRPGLLDKIYTENFKGFLGEVADG